MPAALRPHESGVQAARDGGVGGALDDGAAVGEERQFVGVAPELEHELVVADGAVRLQARGDFVEVNWTLALVDLHGVAPAERDVRASFAGQVNEVALSAGAAILTRARPWLFCSGREPWGTRGLGLFIAV